ncbi:MULTISPECIES: hypothetical protein [Yersinia]|uniref:Uncharacterized protein n=1 Tax=Yersinia hibernica TaxID=2339259 RepID=A0ABX5R4F2_9GAMM|nr:MULTISPECIES: hypothetical protein [Yersinia]PHZ22446.1 hypothetical protein CS535_17325 [Yersinia massiliensis]QAX80268.1 hypothetical protein D5F51_18045 [Yersinia hibernica]
MPDSIDLTTDISSAIILCADWREYQTQITDKFIDHVDVENGLFKQRVIGISGASSDEFMAWVYHTVWKNLCVDGIAEDAPIVYDKFAHVVSDNCQCSGDLRGTPSGNHMPMPS